MKPLTPEQAEDIQAYLEMLIADYAEWVDGRLEFSEEGFWNCWENWLDENTHSFEPPAVIYKGSGFTGAQKGERK